MPGIFPDLVRERIKDDLAENGMTEDDVRELIQKLEGSNKRHLGAGLSLARVRGPEIIRSLDV